MPGVRLSLLLALALAAPAAAAPTPGTPLRPFTLPRVKGEPFHWQPGTSTVIAFVAFWCDTWKAQNAALAGAQRSLQGLPVTFLTVSVDDRWTERAQNKIVGPLLADPGRTFSGPLGIDGVPYLLVVDAEGTIRTASRGIARASLIEQAVRDAVAGPPAAPRAAVYVIFDDFPSSAELDDALLDALRQADVPATFFCRGDRVAANAELVRRAAHAGHSLQVHSWDHRAEEPMLSRCAQALQQTVGIAPTLYHPPGRTELLRLTGESLSLPVVNPYDYLRPGQSELTRRLLLAAKPGTVVLLHAGVPETVEALPGVIAGLRARGVTFGVLR